MLKKYFSQFITTDNKKSFGFSPIGQEVICHTLKNKNGMELAVINYGATITSLKIPMPGGKKIDVVLGFDSLEAYIHSFNLPNAPYFGAIVGRFAGRINNAKFAIEGSEFELSKNHGAHHIHGGFEGFSKAVWGFKTVTSNAIVLEYISQENEENFPGKLTTQITYRVTDDNEIKIEMMATSTADTIINLTQHSYFNLDGHSETIENQRLFINSYKTLETNIENIPSGDFFEIANSPFDFYLPKECPTKIDNTFVLNKENEIAATLFSIKNKLKMSVFTNQPAVHVYVGGNCFNKIKGKENVNYNSLSGICFETQNFPDAPNHEGFPSAVLKKGETYLHTTTLKFEKYNHEKN